MKALWILLLGLVLLAAVRVPAGWASSWPEFGRDNANTSASDETWLTVATAGALTEKVQAIVPEAVAGQPVVVRDTVYVGTLGGQVRAYALADGHEYWTTQLTASIYGSVYVKAGRVYVGDLSATAYCLNAVTGALIWQRQLGDPTFECIYASPTLANGRVVVGISTFTGDNPCVRGRVVAVSAATGAVSWTWYNVDSSSTGGGVWTSAAADDAAGRVYITTGNPCSGNALTSPYCDAILCLDSNTGAEVWHHQVIAGDLGDFDFGSSPVLFTAGIVPAVAAGNKNGVVYAVRRDTGALIWQTQIAAQAGAGGDIGCLSTPTVLSDRLVIGCGQTVDGYPGAIVALNSATGAVLWRYPMMAAVFGSIAATNGVVLASSMRPEIMAFNALTGDSLYKGVMGAGNGAVFGGPAISHGYVLVPNFDYKVYQFSFATVPTGIDIREEDPNAAVRASLLAQVDRDGLVRLTAPGVAGTTRATVVDVAGRLMARVPLLPDGTGASGQWNGTTAAGRRAPNGVYWVRLDGSDARTRFVLGER